MDKPKSEMSFDELVALNHPPELEEDDPVVVSVPGPAPGAKPATAAEAPAAPAASPAKADDKPAAKPEDDPSLSSHDRRIVRALRKEEERNRKEIERLKAENEALKAKAPALDEDEDGDELDDDTIADLEEYSPKVAKYIKKAKETLAAKPPAPAPESTGFVPQALDPEVKAMVEDNPDLFEWHQSPEHADKWEAVTNADVFLSTTPEWKGKGKESVPARLAAAVKLVKASHGTAAPPPAAPAPPAKPTAADAKAIIDAKAAESPLSVDDLRGRTPPTHIPSKRNSWDQMSNDEILAGLPEG